jgi:hypothetical protein
MRKATLVGLGIVVGLALAVFAANFVQLQAPLNSVMDDDSRNEGVDVRVHFGSYINPNVLVFDLRKISGDKSRLDVLRVLLQFADRLQDKEFNAVALAYRGETRFKLDGFFFQTVGREYSFQNPAYTLRTFPENVQRPDGSSAFGSWTGGLLGVLEKQMSDLNRFCDEWFFLDAATEQ